MAKALAALLLVLPLAGCVTLGQVPIGLGPFCELGPIQPTAHDSIRDRKTKERIVLENELGEAKCGWKP
jgi:hypothetical protein